jgi:hypothetical protein
MSVLDTQVGGDHYKGFLMQPVVFVTQNKIGFLPGCVIKRACRYDRPGGKGRQDLEKIVHELQLMHELNYVGRWVDLGIMHEFCYLNSLTDDQATIIRHTLAGDISSALATVDKLLLK